MVTLFSQMQGCLDDAKLYQIVSLQSEKHTLHYYNSGKATETYYKHSINPQRQSPASLAMVVSRLKLQKAMATYYINSIYPLRQSRASLAMVVSRLKSHKAMATYYINSIYSSKVVSSILSNGSVTVKVTGSNGVAAGWGILHYLKHYCNCHISWEADQLNLPKVLPSVNFTISAKDM